MTSQPNRTPAQVYSDLADRLAEIRRQADEDCAKAIKMAMQEVGERKD